MISDKKFTEIVDQFSAYTFSSLQAFDQIVERLKKYGHSIEDMQAYVFENMNNHMQGAKFTEDWKQGKIQLKACPECGSSMFLESVNTCGGNQVPGKNFKSVFTCPRYQYCGYQEWNRGTVGEVKFKHMKENGTFEKYRPTKYESHENELHYQTFEHIKLET